MENETTLFMIHNPHWNTILLSSPLVIRARLFGRIHRIDEKTGSPPFKSKKKKKTISFSKKS